MTSGTPDVRHAVRRFVMKRTPVRSHPVRDGSVRWGDGRRTALRRPAWLAAAFLLMLLSGCLPATVTPRQTVTSLSLREAYAEAVATIDTQPYPASTGGWIITQADPSSAFVAAEMSYRTCGYLPYRFAEFRCQTHTARVSVTLVPRPDGTVLVAIGASEEPQAQDLAEALSARLRVHAVGVER